MPAKKKGLFYCGTSNVTLPVPNKGHFPPEYQNASRLKYYASLFNTVEVNSTFYKLPLLRTVERWAADVPEDFRFSFKLWKGITHGEALMYDPDDIAGFMRVLSGVGNKKGALLVQFPGSIKISRFGKVKTLLSTLENVNDGWPVTVEFRDRSWYNDTVYEMADILNVSIVIHDMPRSLIYEPATDSNTIYVRFHGEKGDYRGGYGDDILQDHASAIKTWLKEGKIVYAYFNNTIGDAVHNAATLKKMVLTPASR